MRRTILAAAAVFVVVLAASVPTLQDGARKAELARLEREVGALVRGVDYQGAYALCMQEPRATEAKCEMRAASFADRMAQARSVPRADPRP